MKFFAASLVLSALASVASAQLMAVYTPRVNQTLTAGDPFKVIIKAQSSLTNIETMASGVKLVRGNHTAGGNVLGSGLLAGQDGGKTKDNSFLVNLPRGTPAGEYTLVFNTLYYIGASEEARIAHNKVPVHVKKAKKPKRATNKVKRSWGVIKPNRAHPQA